MPIVPMLPPGQNVSLIRGLSDRTRSMEARRALIGLATAKVNALVANGSWTLPTGFPSETILVGPSGAVWCQWGYDESLSENALVGVSVDGATPTVMSGEFSGMAGISGITPGYHVFQLQTFGTSSPGLIYNPFITVWPL